MGDSRVLRAVALTARKREEVIHGPPGVIIVYTCCFFLFVFAYNCRLWSFCYSCSYCCCCLSGTLKSAVIYSCARALLLMLPLGLPQHHTIGAGRVDFDH